MNRILKEKNKMGNKNIKIKIILEGEYDTEKEILIIPNLANKKVEIKLKK